VIFAYRYRCDGCGIMRADLPVTWIKRDEWDDGSVTRHYCIRCKKKLAPKEKQELAQKEREG
jgi:hypothetical protein